MTSRIQTSLSAHKFSFLGSFVFVFFASFALISIFISQYKNNDISLRCKLVNYRLRCYYSIFYVFMILLFLCFDGKKYVYNFFVPSRRKKSKMFPTNSLFLFANAKNKLLKCFSVRMHRFEAHMKMHT